MQFVVRRWIYESVILLALMVIVLLVTQWVYYTPRIARFTATTPPVFLPRTGFSVPEQFPNGAGSYRWTNGTAQLRLPNPGGPVRLRLQLAGGPGRSVPVALHYADQIQSFQVSPEPRMYRLLLPPTAGERQMLRIESPVMAEQDGRGERQLGVVVGEIQVAGGGKVPIRIALAVIAAVSGGYALLRLAGRRVLPAAGLVLVPLGLALLVQGRWGWQYAFFSPVLFIVLMAMFGGWLAGHFDRVPPRDPHMGAIPPGWSQRRWLGIGLLDWGAFASILLVTMIYFQPYLFTGKTLIAYDLLNFLPPWYSVDRSDLQNRMMGDVITAHVPWRYLYREGYFSGEIPFWNPYSYGGIPFMAYHQPGVLYPPNLIFLLVNVETGVTIYLFAHIYISGLGMYLLLRRLTLPPFAALTGAVAWMLCGMLTVWLAWLATSVSIVWLPLILLAADWVLVGGTWRAVGGLALATWLTLIAGHPQYIYYNMLTLGVFVLWRSFSLDLTWRQRGMRLSRLAVGGLLGLLIAAVQLVPVIELYTYNTRSGESIEAMMYGALPLRQIITLFAPEFYGGPNGYRGSGNFVEFTGYIGVSSIVIGALALLHPHLRRHSTIWFFTGVTLVALHLVYGGVLNVLFSQAPAYTEFRGLQRIQNVWSFGAAGMVACGVEALRLAHGWRRRIIGTVAGVLLATGVWMVWQTAAAAHMLAWPALTPRLNNVDLLIAPLRQAGWLLVGVGCVLALLLWAQWNGGSSARLAPVALLLLIAVDLLQFSRSYLPVVDVSLAFPTTPGLDYLVAHRAEGRIARFKRGHLDAPLPVNTNIVYRLDDLQGYGSFTLDSYNQIVGLIEPEQYAQVANTNRLVNFQDIDALKSPILDLLGVRFC